MVYQIFNDGIESSVSANNSKKFKIKQQKQRSGHPKTSTNSTWSVLAASLLIVAIKVILVIYDLVSLPIYYILQRPDKRAKDSQRMKAQQVDANTWIRTSCYSDDNDRYSCNLFNLNMWQRRHHNQCSKPMQFKFMGSSISEIFTNAVREFHSKWCLGYRAVVTCQNEAGANVFEQKSFRSDYTWYTYGQIGRRVQDIASGLYYHSVYPTSRAMFMASTCLEWFCVAHACFQLAIELVLVPDVSDPKTLESILIDSDVQVLFITCDQMERVCELLNFISDRANKEEDLSQNVNQTTSGPLALKRIILIDWQFSIDFDEQQFDKLGKAIQFCSNHLEILSIGQIEEAGIDNPIRLRCSKAISEENLNLDGFNDNSNNGEQGKQNVSASRCFNFSFNSNGPQSPKKRKVSGELVNAWQTGCDRSFKATSAPIQSCVNNEAGDITTEVEANQTNQSWDRESVSCIDSFKTPRPEDLAIVVYTYGSLGQLKPIMLTHSQLARISDQMFLDGMIADNEVHCTILSLDSVIEFMMEICVFSHGGSIGYSCNLETFFYDGTDLFARDKSDLEAIKPSFLLVRPYLLERLRKSTQNYLEFQLNPIVSFIFKNVFYDYKKYWVRRHFATPIIDRVLCSRLKRLFGSNIKYIICNGATDCSETKDFFAFMADLPVIELYGPDEAIVSLMSIKDSWDYKRRSRTKFSHKKSGYSWRLLQFDANHADDKVPDEEAKENLDDFQQIQLMPPTINRNIYTENLSRNILIISSILYPTHSTRIRLEDWEEFRITDQPYPRGRLVIGGDVVCKGYLKRPTLTKETSYVDSNFVKWFKTDDIARAFPNGSFEIISAISDMIKMVDGQFISLSQIERLIRNSQFVDNVCAICGEDRTFVINLVVPNLRCLALKSLGTANMNMTMSMEPEAEELANVDFRREVCNDRLLCELVSDHLNDLLARSGLSSITNRFLLVPEIWTPESELVTPAFKPKRGAIQKYYANDIQAIIRLEFGMISHRLSARRKKRMTSPSSRNHHHLQLTNRSNGGSLSSLESI